MVQDHNEAWCIAKLQRLIGRLDPPIENLQYQEEFFVADELAWTTYQHPETKEETPFMTVGSLRKVLESLPGPKVAPELLDFIDFLLVVDHTKRPTASEALRHPFLHYPPIEQAVMVRAPYIQR